MPTKSAIIFLIHVLAFQFASSTYLHKGSKARVALIQLLKGLALQESDYQVEDLMNEPAGLDTAKRLGLYYEKEILIAVDGCSPAPARSKDEAIAIALENGRDWTLKCLRKLRGKVYKVIAYYYTPGLGEYDTNYYRGKKGEDYVRVGFFGELPKSGPEVIQTSIVTPKDFASPQCVQLLSQLLNAMHTLYEKDFCENTSFDLKVNKTVEQFLQDEIKTYSNK